MPRRALQHENAQALYRDKSIADVLACTVDDIADFFIDDPQVSRTLQILQEVGLGYLRLGQPATKLSGGEAQRVKLATGPSSRATRTATPLHSWPPNCKHRSHVRGKLYSRQFAEE